jgi:membrane protein implicated in regulation of membrane protease activity
MNLDWFQEWQALLGLAIALGVAELFSLDLILLMLAVGALAGMVLGLAGLPLAAQVLAAVGASLAMLAFVRPSVVKRLHSGPELTLGHSALVGKQAVAVGEISRHTGQIRVNGELWTARPYDDTLVIAEGAQVEIFEIKGATALVHEVPSLEP